MKEFPKWVNFFRPAPIKARSQKIYKRINKLIEKRPLGSFFAIMAVLFVLIVIGNFLGKPKVTEQKAKEPIIVKTYSIGSAPRITVPAQIEKEGVIQIEAQTPGIVYKINVKDGQSVHGVIIQEGVYTAEQVEGSTAETVIYMMDNDKLFTNYCNSWIAFSD